MFRVLSAFIHVAPIQSLDLDMSINREGYLYMGRLCMVIATWLNTYYGGGLRIGIKVNIQLDRSGRE